RHRPHPESAGGAHPTRGRRGLAGRASRAQRRDGARRRAPHAPDGAGPRTAPGRSAGHLGTAVARRGPRARLDAPGGRDRPAGSVALEAVRRVIDERAYSNLLVPALLGRSGLDDRDRAFAAELAYGTLRRRIPLDHMIEARASRPIARMSQSARHALRLGAY